MIGKSFGKTASKGTGRNIGSDSSGNASRNAGRSVNDDTSSVTADASDIDPFSGVGVDPVGAGMPDADIDVGMDSGASPFSGRSVDGGPGVDFNPLYGNEAWRDAPSREAPDVKDEHDRTSLDSKLSRSSSDSRRSVIYLHYVVTVLIGVMAVGAIGGLIYFGFTYAFM